MDNNNMNNNGTNNSNDLNSLTGKAKEIWGSITKTTDSLLSSSKAKIQKTSLQNDQKDAYTRLGNAYYDSVRLGQNNDEVIQAALNQIDELGAEIDRITREIDELDNINRCKKCGASNPLDSKFCSQCGALLDPPPVIREEDFQATAPVPPTAPPVSVVEPTTNTEE